MRYFFIGITAVFAMVSSISCRAESDPEQTAAEPQAIHFDQFVVRVVNEQADIFTGERSSGHGTGYIFDISEGEITIFTNRHVTQNSPRTAQRILLEFTPEEGEPERVEGVLQYQSWIRDFAVVRVKTSSLKRTLDRVHPALFPQANSPIYQIRKYIRQLKGRMAVAVGNPLISENATTYGQINGLVRMEDGEVYIQTQAPINGGNSGGPLIDEETGIVIGMNTAKIQTADNYGLAIPIHEILEDYAYFLENPSVAASKDVLFDTDVITGDEIALRGLKPIIEKAFPENFVVRDLLQVTDAISSMNSFQTGDLILTANGIPIGGSEFELRKLIQTNDTIQFTVLRNGAIVQLDQDFPQKSFRRFREQADFVILSGLIFQQDSLRQAWATDRSVPSRVRLVEQIDDSEMQFSSQNFPPPGSMLVGINIENRDYHIETLLDLKLALRNHPNARAARLDIRRSIYVHTANMRIAVVNPMKTQMVNGTVTSHTIPITEVITPWNLSLQGFTNQYSFDPQAFETRNWRKFIRQRAAPVACGSILKKAN